MNLYSLLALYAQLSDINYILKPRAVEQEKFYNKYCKTLYFSCILIWRIWSLEISLHFNLAFSHGLL